MKLKRITALFLAALTCMLALASGVSAAESKNSIKLSKTSVTLEVGDTVTLKPTVAKKCTISWSTSNKNVATVKKGGVVTAKKQGKAIITVKIKGTDYNASCKVTVVKKGSGNKDAVKTDTKTEKKKETASSSGSKSGQELLDKMTVGWNLGNALDCTGGETAWGNPKTTKAMIDKVKAAGFSTVRIPVTWDGHMDADGKVHSSWMDRVQEVVDYAVDNDMYIILNVHHDMGWIKLTDDKAGQASLKKYKKLWTQIAERFKNYDEKLLFSGINEPRTTGSAKEWTGGTDAEREVLNKYYETFVDAVRGAGGKNKTRYLIITPYAASKEYAAMAGLKIPDDERIIVSVHAYMPGAAGFDGNMNNKTLTEDGKKEIENTFSNINKVFVSKGIPVIMDECGVVNKNNEDERVKMMEYHIKTAKKYGIPCVVWDNNAFNTGAENFGLLNRNTLEWQFPKLVEAIVNAAK